MGINIIDVIIVIIPLFLVFYMAFKSRKYIRGATDFLSAGRLCGRYVIGVADVANALAIITLVGFVEKYYKAGFSIFFWNSLNIPISIVLALTGFCIYRFRATRSMSLGQFLEMRYNRAFRIFASGLRTISEMLANMIMPAIAARFFINFLGLPSKILICGFEIETFMLLVLFLVSLGIIIICMGGVLALVVTDSIQGMICYPLIITFIIFILYKFSWDTEIAPVMADRIVGESFFNPLDIDELRDFNFFAIFVTLFTTVLHRASWLGNGMTTAAKSPHEQKMSSMLGAFRGASTTMFYVLIAMCIITLMNHKNYANEAKEVRDNLSSKIIMEISENKNLQDHVTKSTLAIPTQEHIIGTDNPLSQKQNLDTIYLNTVHNVLKEYYPNDTGKANNSFREFNTLYHQIMLPATIRKILPAGLFGAFCLLMLMAMISTDDSRIFNATLTFTQDVIMPLKKKPFTPKEHINTLRIVSLCVGAFFFLGSFFMSQMDYILLFSVIMTSIWLGGCGPVMIFGLYSKFGTTAGAFTSLITGMIFSVSGIFMQRQWAGLIYPWLERNEQVENVGSILRTISEPFNPYIVWEMNPTKFPINSYEIYFITMIITLSLYVIVSYFTCKEPFNLDRMLHRGKYAATDDTAKRDETTESSSTNKKKGYSSMQRICIKLLGITPEYSKGDKVIAVTLFLYSFGYNFVLNFVFVLLWNYFVAPLSIEFWSWYFYIILLVVPGFVAFVVTFWFGIGGVLNLIELFENLKNRVVNPLDDGRVEGHVSLADIKHFQEVEQTVTKVTKK